MAIHMQIKNRQTGNIQKKKTYQLGMQHREYLEVVQLVEVQHHVEFDTLGAHQAFKITYMQEVIDEVDAEETNEHTQRRQTSIHKEGKSTTHTTSRGNQNLCVYRVQRSNLAQRGTQEQLRGEIENRRWIEREKQKERNTASKVE